jgi:hypothetical protein
MDAKLLANLSHAGDALLQLFVRALQPPFLRAKLVGTKLLISRAALIDWMESLPDAWSRHSG